MHKQKEWKPNSLKGSISLLPFRYFKKFEEECVSKNATLLIFPPAFRLGAYEYHKEKIEQIWRLLERYELPIVSAPVRYALPDSLYYDTDYHLTYDGVIMRTSMLISDIDSVGIISL